MDMRWRGHVAASLLLVAMGSLPFALAFATGHVPPGEDAPGLLAFTAACFVLAGWSWRTRHAPPGLDPRGFERRFAVLRAAFTVAVLGAGGYLLATGRLGAGAVLIVFGLLRGRKWAAAAKEYSAAMRGARTNSERS